MFWTVINMIYALKNNLFYKKSLIFRTYGYLTKNKEG